MLQQIDKGNSRLTSALREKGKDKFMQKGKERNVVCATNMFM